jgi:S1-C subfamily serine protease
MLAWDRAMAQGIAEFLRREPDRLVVAVMGSGHLRHGHGVPHQLHSLGVDGAVVALPWDSSEPCADLVAGVADVVFGLQRRPEPPAPDRPRLGISFDRGEEGLVVREVAPDSPAERAGLKAGDLLVTIAGVSTSDVESLVSAVRRVAPGTWLPLRVRRDGETVELIAKFPPP